MVISCLSKCRMKRAVTGDNAVRRDVRGDDGPRAYNRSLADSDAWHATSKPIQTLGPMWIGRAGTSAAMRRANDGTRSSSRRRSEAERYPIGVHQDNVPGDQGVIANLYLGVTDDPPPLRSAYSPMLTRARTNVEDCVFIGGTAT